MEDAVGQVRAAIHGARDDYETLYSIKAELERLYTVVDGAIRSLRAVEIAACTHDMRIDPAYREQCKTVKSCIKCGYVDL
jgi:predicted metal-dependent HD superfamily phosphohydrolase